MPGILIIVNEIETGKRLQSELAQIGLPCFIVSSKEKDFDRKKYDSPELILLEMTQAADKTILHDLTYSGKIKNKVPIIGLVNAEGLAQPIEYLGIDDFVFWPFERHELIFRVERLLHKNLKEDEIIRSGDLMLDLANCEVRVGGKVVELTFKEYELLKFLIHDRGRVYSREALLNKVWGYDYFGGDRTVDVHIRRLRSKIEVSGQTFIETVRNIGYRFTKTK